MGAVHYISNSHSTPNQFMKSFYTWLQKKGVEFKLREEVTEIVSENQIIKGVRTRRLFIMQMNLL